MLRQDQRMTTRDFMFFGITLGLGIGFSLGVMTGVLGSLPFLIGPELDLLSHLTTLPSSDTALFFIIAGLWAANIVACPIAGLIAGLPFGALIGGALVGYEKIRAACRMRNTLDPSPDLESTPNENTALIQPQPSEEVTASLPLNHASPLARLISCFSCGNTQPTPTENPEDSMFNNPGTNSAPQNQL